VLLGVAAAGGTYWYFDWSGLVGRAAHPCGNVTEFYPDLIDGR